MNVDARRFIAVLSGQLRCRQIQRSDAQRYAAADITLRYQILNNRFCIVDWNREAQALDVFTGRFGDDDADQFAIGIEQTASGVARINGGVGLKQVPALIVQNDFPVERADDTVGNRPAQLA